MVQQGVLRIFKILPWELKLRYLPESQEYSDVESKHLIWKGGALMSLKFFDPLWIKIFNSNLRHSELRKTEPSQLINERHGRKVTKAILQIAWSDKRVIEQGEK